MIIEATGVEPAGRITAGCVGLYSEANEVAMKRVVDFCKSVGDSKVAVQLAHAGQHLLNGHGRAVMPLTMEHGRPTDRRQLHLPTAGTCLKLLMKPAWPS